MGFTWGASMEGLGVPAPEVLGVDWSWAFMGYQSV